MSSERNGAHTYHFSFIMLTKKHKNVVKVSPENVKYTCTPKRQVIEKRRGIYYYNTERTVKYITTIYYNLRDIQNSNIYIWHAYQYNESLFWFLTNIASSDSYSFGFDIVRWQDFSLHPPTKSSIGQGW